VAYQGTYKRGADLHQTYHKLNCDGKNLEKYVILSRQKVHGQVKGAVAQSPPPAKYATGSEYSFFLIINLSSSSLKLR
jgi:hypothetical protein